MAILELKFKGKAKVKKPVVHCPHLDVPRIKGSEILADVKNCNGCTYFKGIPYLEAITCNHPRAEQVAKLYSKEDGNEQTK